jgi:hypothetical protein
MGTNFHATRDGDGVEAAHLGKRSAAGLYCWDCDLTLCAGGIDGIHQSASSWHAVCPRCGSSPVPRDEEGGLATELWGKTRATRPSGVRSCSSFTWSQQPEAVGRFCQVYADEDVIEDEYGGQLTGHAFLDMLAANVAVQFTHALGQEFS